MTEIIVNGEKFESATDARKAINRAKRAEQRIEAQLAVVNAHAWTQADSNLGRLARLLEVNPKSLAFVKIDSDNSGVLTDLVYGNVRDNQVDMDPYMFQLSHGHITCAVFCGSTILAVR